MPDPTPRSSPLAVGDAVPDFTLADQDRKDWRLSDAVRLGDVVLCFFPFAFTGVCGTEMACVTREMASWKQKGAQVVGISCDSAFVQKAWAKAEGFAHTLLSDQHRRVCQMLGLFWPEMNTTRRATLVIGRNAEGAGRVRWIDVREAKDAMDWSDVLSHVG